MSKGKDYRFFKSILSAVAGDGLLQGQDDELERGINYNFLTGIVNDVITNPYEYLRTPVAADPSVTVGEMLSGRKKVKDIKAGLSNKDLVDSAPMNSIIAQIIDPGRASTDGVLPVLCYPFFPPHLSLPLNPGEYVWIIECDVKGSKMYYWMCRQVGPIHVDDLNYTSMERLTQTVEIVDSFNKNAGSKKPSTDLLDAAVSLDGSTDKSNSNSGFSKIFANSNAYRSEFTGEPVPRLAKDCSDLLLQGSNNTGIHLTTEKFSKPEDTDLKNTKHTGKSNEKDALPTRKPDSSAIDIFVKRKKNSLDQLVELIDDSEKFDGINTVKNVCSNDVYTYIENDKLASLRYQDDSVYDKELNDDGSDALNVGARLYLSHKCDIDNTFLINFDVLGEHTKMGPSIITFAQHNRVVGEQDVRLVSRSGQSFVDLDEKGNIIIKTKSQKVILKEDGNVVINASGKIFLQENAPQSFVRAEDLATELTKLKTALSTMANALTSGGFCPFPAGPNAVLGGAMGALAGTLGSVQVAPTAPWVSKKIKGE